MKKEVKSIAKSKSKAKAKVESDSCLEPGEELDLDSVEGGKECALCHDIPESIVYLSCDHIVCLICVAKLLLSSQEEGKEVDFSEVQCGLCEQITILSKEVQETLLEFLNTAEMQNENRDNSEENQYAEEGEEVEEEGEGEDEEGEEEREPEESEHNESEEEEEEEVVSQPARKARKLQKEKPHDKMEYYEDQSKNFTEGERQDGGFSFMCDAHPGEEFVYYHSGLQRLLCAQCLLTCVDHRSLGEVRPIKKCLPEIMNDFQSLLSKTELRAQLLSNRRKDFEIRREHIRKEALDSLKRVELALDEVADLAQSLKAQARKNFEAQLDRRLEEASPCERQLEGALEYFSGIIDTVQGIQDSSQSPEEEFFSFFLANQEKLRSALAQEEENPDHSRGAQPFDALASQTRELASLAGREAAQVLVEKIATKLGFPFQSESLRAEQTPRQIFSSARKSVQTPFASDTGHGLLSRLKQSAQSNAKMDLPGLQDFSSLSKTNLGFANARLSRPNNPEIRESLWAQVARPARASSSTDILHMKGLGFSPSLAKLDSLGSSSQYSLMKKKELEGKLKLFDLRYKDQKLARSQQVNASINHLSFLDEAQERYRAKLQLKKKQKKYNF